MLGGKFSGVSRYKRLLCRKVPPERQINFSQPLFFLTLLNHLANVAGLRWAYFTRRALGRLWGRSTEYGFDQNCHSRRAPAQSEEYQPRNSAQRADRHYWAFRIG